MASKETKQPKRFAHAKAGKSPMKLGQQAKSSAKFSARDASPLKLEPDNEKNKSAKKRK